MTSRVDLPSQQEESHFAPPAIEELPATLADTSFGISDESCDGGGLYDDESDEEVSNADRDMHGEDYDEGTYTDDDYYECDEDDDNNFDDHCLTESVINSRRCDYTHEEIRDFLIRKKDGYDQASPFSFGIQSRTEVPLLKILDRRGCPKSMYAEIIIRGRRKR